MGINLCRGNIRMAQKFLNDAEIGTPFQQMGCKRMPERVRRDFLPNPRLLGITADDLPDGLARQMFSRTP